MVMRTRLITTAMLVSMIVLVPAVASGQSDVEKAQKQMAAMMKGSKLQLSEIGPPLTAELLDRFMTGWVAEQKDGVRISDSGVDTRYEACEQKARSAADVQAAATKKLEAGGYTEKARAIAYAYEDSVVVARCGRQPNQEFAGQKAARMDAVSYGRVKERVLTYLFYKESDPKAVAFAIQAKPAELALLNARYGRLKQISEM